MKNDRSSIMDNFHLDITSRSKTHFDEALKIAFDQAPGNVATHYKISKKFGFILYWDNGDNKSVKELPYKMDYKDAIAFVWGWLQKVEYNDFDNQLDDSDVQNEKAFRIFNEDWGHVDNDSYAFIAIKPVWAWLGK